MNTFTRPLSSRSFLLLISWLHVYLHAYHVFYRGIHIGHKLSSSRFQYTKIYNIFIKTRSKKPNNALLTGLVKTGMSHSRRSSPRICCTFLRTPTLKPFLSGPETNTGAEKASGEKEKSFLMSVYIKHIKE